MDALNNWFGTSGTDWEFNIGDWSQIRTGSGCTGGQLSPYWAKVNDLKKEACAIGGCDTGFAYYAPSNENDFHI